MTFGTSATNQGDLVSPTAREAVEHGPHLHTAFHAQAWKHRQCAQAYGRKWAEALIGTRTNAWHAGLFVLHEEELAVARPAAREASASKSAARPCVQPRKRGAGSTERLPAQDEVKL